MILKKYAQFGGMNPETASLAHLLEYHGILSPQDGKPFSETMLLGIGGGIGGGYFLFEFGKQANVYIGTRYLWQNPKQYLEQLCLRLGVPHAFTETAGVKAAAKNLNEAIASGHPAITWVDLANLPYAYLPKSLSGMVYHFIVVYGLDEKKNLAYLADRAPTGVTVTLEELANARSRISSNKNRLLTVEKPKKKIDLKAAILSGIHACLNELNNPKISNFGLPAIAKWGDLVNNPKDKKGWPQVFAEGDGYFYGALRWSFAYIETYQTPGAAFRGMYADFLEQAAPITGLSALSDAAAKYRALAEDWHGLADAFLPAAIAPLQALRELVRKRHTVFAEQGAGPWVQETSESIETALKEVAANPPLTANDRPALFVDLQQRIRKIHQAEIEACALLSQAVS